MEHDPDLLINALRSWGRIGFWFFIAVGVIISAVLVLGGNLSLRGVLVICAIFALGFVALGLADFYGWIARRLFSGRG